MDMEPKLVNLIVNRSRVEGALAVAIVSCASSSRSRQICLLSTHQHITVPTRQLALIFTIRIH